jgi:hypothetical protein
VKPHRIRDKGQRLSKASKTLILLASPARFELTTPGLGILCSILLSYGDFSDYFNHLAYIRPRNRWQESPRGFIGASRDKRIRLIIPLDAPTQATPWRHGVTFWWLIGPSNGSVSGSRLLICERAHPAGRGVRLSSIPRNLARSMIIHPIPASARHLD